MGTSPIPSPCLQVKEEDMGKATRWLRGLLGGRKEGGDDAAKERRRLGSVDEQRDGVEMQRRKAVDVVVVVRNRSSVKRPSFCGEGTEFAAALRIQSVFRGFLARKALRALRALVKLQALVRGFLVRKQAAAALHSMQALIRAQTIVLNRRSRILPCRDPCRLHPEFHPRRSLERYDGWCDSPRIVEIDANVPRWRNRRASPCSCCTLIDEPFPSPRPPHFVPPRLSITKSRTPHEQDWYPIHDGSRRPSTAHDTPRFHDPSGPTAPPVTPSRSVRRGVGYMANTQSFTAKVRSHSAPRQRPGSPRTNGGGAGEAAAVVEERRRRSCSQAPDGLDGGEEVRVLSREESEGLRMG